MSDITIIRKISVQAAGTPLADHVHLAKKDPDNEIRRELGFQSGESYGVGNRAVSDKAHRAYEIEKVLKKTLAMHDNLNLTSRGVDYDGLSIRYTDDPAPECAITEGATP